MIVTTRGARDAVDAFASGARERVDERRGCRTASAALYARVRLFYALWHTRSRVQRAPGIPCALWFEGEDKEFASLGRNRAARSRRLATPGAHAHELVFARDTVPY